jgi:hypothetical protein
MSPAPLARAGLHVTNLEFNIHGSVDLSEALPEEGGRTYLLSEEDAEDVNLDIGHCTDPDIRDTLGYFIELSVYHRKNPETNRVFHANMTVHPTRGDIVRLRDFLDFLLRQPDE